MQFNSSDAALDELVLCAHQSTQSGIEKALETTDAVLRVCQHSNSARHTADAYRARVHALCFAGRYGDALQISREGITQATKAGCLAEAGRLQMASMHALVESGRLHEAISAGVAARETLNAIGETALAARAEINLGIAHQRHDQPAEALDCFLRARNGLRNEPMMLGHLENSRGETLLTLNDFTGAERAFHAALAVFEEHGALLTAAIARSNLADLAARQGHLQKALAHFEGARRHLEQHRSPPHLARLVAEQAEAKAVLGLPHDALLDYEDALGDLDRCGLALEAARARCGMGLVLLRLNRPAEAETALAAATAGFEELGHTTSRARVDLVRAELALRDHRIADARRLATRAMSVLGERPADAALARLLLARVAMIANDPETAEADLQAAIAAARQLDLAPLLADCLETRGRLYRTLRRHDPAVNDLTQAVAQIERVRGSLQAERFRTAFLGQRTSAHEALLLALLDRDQPGAIADAFSTVEQAKSRTLLEQLQAGAQDVPVRDGHVEDPVEADLRDRLHGAQSELNALYSRLADDRDVQSRHGDTHSWQQAVRGRERELAELESRLATMSAGRDLFSRPVDLATVQECLGERELLLEYFIADGDLFIFAINRASAAVYRNLAPVAEIVQQLGALKFQIDRALRPGALAGARADRLLRDVRSCLNELYGNLIAPLRDRIGDFHELVLVPHGPLHLVPFHALFDGEQYLVETHQLTTAPSASMYYHLTCEPRADLSTQEFSPLVVGVSDESAAGIAEEARAIGRILNCPDDRVLIDEGAKADVVATICASASPIHLACHGRYLPENPFGSGLKLADRWLTVREISELRLDAELVTLSGCETGVSTIETGDEHTGLMRSFFEAGAVSIIVSLWRVDDETTRNFMSRLYESWATIDRPRRDCRAILSAAQREALRVNPHPAYWAPFQLIGRP